MADNISAATDAVKQQQAALLQAIAEQGSRGQALFDQNAQQADQERQAAVGSALNRASTLDGPGGSGAPAALVAQLQSSAAAPGDRRTTDIANAKTYFDQDQQRLSSANDAYMNQLSAAVPLAVNRAQAQANEAAAQRAMQKQLADMDLEGKRLSLEGQRLDLQNRLTASKTPTVAEQQYAAEQSAAANRQHALDTANQFGDPAARDAFAALVANNDDLPSAMADLATGLRTPAVDGDGKPIEGGGSQFNHDWGNVDPGVIQYLLQMYYTGAGVSGSGSTDGPTPGAKGPQ